jgi:ATP-binding cassette subfamily C protein CydCD
VGGAVADRAGGLAAAAAAKDILALPAPGPSGTAALPSGRDLVVEDVTVTYPDGTRVLDGVSLEVGEGECVAVMGDSGAGKSTLLLALMGLVAPAEGRVLVGGRDLSELDAEAWRRDVAWVPQRPWLLAGSLRDNLLVGSAGASEDGLLRAVRDARVDEFLDDLPHGLYTQVGERGLGLSLGQRRRVALARALLRDAPVLLLDEPTADLDLRSECEVVAALRTVCRGRTVVVTTHRAAPFVGWTRAVRLAAPALRCTA